MAELNQDRISNIVSNLVAECRKYRDQLADERVTANEYYDGIMRDTPSDLGRSKVVSRDVRSQVKKVKPSVTRIILGNDKVVEYEPVGQNDEQAAEQATDFINYVVFPESGGYEAVEDAIDDALKLRNGFIRVWNEQRAKVTISRHSGLDENALAQLVSPDDIEVLEQSSEQSVVDGPEGPMPVMLYDVKIRRRTLERRNKIEAIAPEQILIHPDTLDIETSPIAGIGTKVRRTDLIEMGYDRELVMNLPANSSTDDSGEEMSRRRDYVDDGDEEEKATQEIDYYDLYVRVDINGDGVAELVRFVSAGGTGIDNILEIEETDEIPLAPIVCERRPHQWEGNSITDDMKDIQRIKTVLLRQTLDNIYWQNNPQPVVQEGIIQNPESVTNPSFGEPIRVREGTPVQNAYTINQIPFVAQASFSMLSYLDNEATDRTGISDASSGMAPDALQNMTAKATSLIEAAGIGQTEMMVRTIAHSLKRVFKLLLKLTIKHQDIPRTVRLRGEWVTYDPRQWNSEMDASVNTGLGAGTRERDMMMMQVIMGLQEKLLANFGAANNPYVKPDDLWASIEKTVEATGLRSADQFFTKPSPEEIQQAIEAQSNKPDPEMQKAEMQAQIAQQKAAMDLQIAQIKTESDERLRMAELQSQEKIKLYQIDQEIQLKRIQNAANVAAGMSIRPTIVGGGAG